MFADKDKFDTSNYKETRSMSCMLLDGESNVTIAPSAEGKPLRVRIMEELGKASQSKQYPNERYVQDPIFNSVVETLARNGGQPSIELIAQLLDVIENQQEAIEDLSAETIIRG